MFPTAYFAAGYFTPSYFYRPASVAAAGPWPWFTDYADSGVNAGGCT